VWWMDRRKSQSQSQPRWQPGIAARCGRARAGRVASTVVLRFGSELSCSVVSGMCVLVPVHLRAVGCGSAMAAHAHRAVWRRDCSLVSDRWAPTNGPIESATRCLGIHHCSPSITRHTPLLAPPSITTVLFALSSLKFPAWLS
jgi:hypothetical protein